MGDALSYAAPRACALVDELDQAPAVTVSAAVLALGWSCNRDLGIRSIRYRASGLEPARSRHIGRGSR